MALVRDVVLGLTGFLEFEFYAGRAYAFNERGITSQIIQIIHSSESVAKFECEKPHPILNSIPKRGRPKSVDIHWVSERNGQSSENWLEYKWFGFSTPTLNAMLDDVYRLAIISKRNLGNSYFFAFGMKRSIQPFLTGDRNRRKGGQHEILRHTSGTFPRLRWSQLDSNLVDGLNEKMSPVPLPDTVTMWAPFSTATQDAYPSRCCGFGFQIL